MAERVITSERPERATKPRVYRVSEIPASWSSETLRNALERHGLDILSDIQLVPSVLTKGKCTATLSLDANSQILRDLSQQPMNEHLIHAEGTYLVIDQHFYGLTAISSPSTDAKVEYVQLRLVSTALPTDTDSLKISLVAVHGLSGHAFGSWSHFDESTKKYIMWLRDFLGEDVPGIRVMIYGYEARLDKTTTMSRLIDYRRSFLGELLSCRRGNEVRMLYILALVHRED
jgi:hypothetical protein